MAIDVVTSTSPGIAADPIGINHQRGYLQLALKFSARAARHVDRRYHLHLANNDRCVYYILPQLFRNMWRPERQIRQPLRLHLRCRKLSEGHETKKEYARTRKQKDLKSILEGSRVKIKRSTGKRTTQINGVVPTTKERGINSCAVNHNLAPRTDSSFVEASKSTGLKRVGGVALHRRLPTTVARNNQQWERILGSLARLLSTCVSQTRTR